LTGYRYLDGFTSDDAQYTALMNAGAAFAQQYGLRVGVALTAAQMAQLTSDIVWLVEQTVTLPDGSTQRVLVPQVYVRVKPGDIDGSGAVLSGGSVDMRFSGDLTNAGGTIAGRHVVSLSADNINNLAGRITGEDVTVSARTDINVIGAVVDASKSLTAIAGRDINVITTTRDSKSDTGPLARSSADSGVNLSATTLDRVAGLYVTNPGGSLNIAAVRDANLIGAELKSAGNASVTAGRDVNIGTVTTGRKEDMRWSSDNTRKEHDQWRGQCDHRCRAQPHGHCCHGERGRDAQAQCRRQAHLERGRELRFGNNDGCAEGWLEPLQLERRRPGNLAGAFDTYWQGHRDAQRR
jgi:adhesin HecA-like repeat protein